VNDDVRTNCIIIIVLWSNITNSADIGLPLQNNNNNNKQKQNSCNNVSPRDKGFLGNICMDTLHKEDNDDDDDDDENNNNNNNNNNKRTVAIFFLNIITFLLVLMLPVSYSVLKSGFRHERCTVSYIRVRSHVIYQFVLLKEGEVFRKSKKFCILLKVFSCFLMILTNDVSLYSKNQFVFAKDTGFILCGVGTESVCA